MSLGIRHIATEPANLSQKYFAMDKKKSPLLRNKTKSITGHTSDSVSVLSNINGTIFLFSLNHIFKVLFISLRNAAWRVIACLQNRTMSCSPKLLLEQIKVASLVFVLHFLPGFPAHNHDWIMKTYS